MLAFAAVAFVGTARTAEAQCPAGWTQFGTSCYMLSPHALPWTGQRGNANAAGGYLASIGSAAENAFLVTFYQGLGQSTVAFLAGGLVAVGTAARRRRRG